MRAGCFGLKHCEGSAGRTKFFCICVNMGAYNYHSTKNFEIFETGTNGTENSWEKFQKIRKLLSFRRANHSTENSGNSRMKVKWDGNFQENFYQNLGIPHEVVLFSGIYAIFYSALASSFSRDHS